MSTVFPAKPGYRRRLSMVGLLILSTSISLSILLMRHLVTGSYAFRFLVWDLFLAWVPFWIALSIYVLHERGCRKCYLLIGLGVAWLLFFPNAPYLLTEFTHLNSRHRGGPWWCDLMMTVGFALNGLILGLLSLYAVHHVVAARVSPLIAWLCDGSCLMLGSYGISLGRFDRFNSWDILRRPFKLLAFVADEFLRPTAHAKLFMTALMLFAVLSMAYLMLWTLMTMRAEEARCQGNE